MRYVYCRTREKLIYFCQGYFDKRFLNGLTTEQLKAIRYRVIDMHENKESKNELSRLTNA